MEIPTLKVARLLFFFKLGYETMVIITAEMSLFCINSLGYIFEGRKKKNLNASNRCVVKGEQRGGKQRGGTVHGIHFYI